MMNSLGLSPLPSVRNDDESDSFLMERDGFVDEAVVAAMLTAPHHSTRTLPIHEDLALSADDMDFAGWRISSTAAFRGVVVTQTAEVPTDRRPAPPIVEPGLGASHHGGHRWWLAGLAGALSTMLFSVLFVSLSNRPGSSFETILAPRTLADAKPAPFRQDNVAEKTTELTDISSSR